MKPVSGKIDRKCLPKLSDLPANGELAVMESCEDASIRARDADAALDPGQAEVLAICRAVFEMPLGLDDGFAEAGGHSIMIARLAQKLQAAGWAVSVRALLTDCNTARKIAVRSRATLPAPANPEPAATREVRRPPRDEAAAEVLSIGHFTTLQVVFAICLYSPAVLTLLLFVGLVDLPEFFTTASLWGFIAVESLWYSLVLIVPLGNLLWVMLLKSYLGGHHRRNNVTPGIYPKWSRMHLRIWCISRMEHSVLLPIRVMYRSPPLMAFMLRQLGASVGANVQCAQDAELPGPLDLLSIGDDVSISTAAYIQTSTWAEGNLHVGLVRLEKGCKVDMRAGVAPGVTVGRGAWVTPFTPVHADVGQNEMWEGAPARMTGLCTELDRTAAACRRHDYPVWLLETLTFIMQMILAFWLTVVPTAAILWLLRGVVPGEGELTSAFFQVTPLPEIVLRLALYAFTANWITVVATSLLACLFIRWTAAVPGLYPARGLKCALLIFRMSLLNRVQRRWTWTITGQYLRALAGMRFRRVGASECDLMTNLVPEAASADSSVFFSNGSFTNMLDHGTGYFKLRRLDMPQNFFTGNNCVAEFGSFPSNFTLGVSTPGSEMHFRRQMRTRPGEPMAVAGNPPVKFAIAAFEAENSPLARPTFLLFLTRVAVFDVFSIGLLRSAEMLLFAVLYVTFLRWTGSPIIVVAGDCPRCRTSLPGHAQHRDQEEPRRPNWGIDHSTPFWSWRHFAYFFAQDCFFEWCRRPLAFLAGTVLSNSILRRMGCRIGSGTIVTQPMQCSDWNAVSFGKDCVVDGYLQFHTFENKMLKVKRTTIEDGCTVAFGATVMGGAWFERDTYLLPLALVLKEMAMSSGTYEGSPAAPVSAARLGRSHLAGAGQRAPDRWTVPTG
jgi:non-ribosomal peptide synthetase-like protein